MSMRCPQLEYPVKPSNDHTSSLRSRSYRPGRDLRSAEAMLDAFAADREIMDEVDRLLAGRTRDVRLVGAIDAAYRLRFRRQTAKIVRSWMLWVIFLDLFMAGLNTILLPWELAAAMVLPSAMILPAALGVIYVWRRPEDHWLAGWALLAGLSAILLCVAWMGVVGGQDLLERYLHIMLFVAITGIIIFNLPFTQSIAIAMLAMAIYLIFQLIYLEESLGIMLSGFFFYGSGVAATVLARRTMNILSHKSFLLELRDRHHMAELARTNQRLERLSRFDGLTGVANRHYLDERLAQFSRQMGQIAFLMCDIDDFKALNDMLGHIEGDRCLQQVAHVLSQSTREDVDCVARFGGEEFLVVLAGADITHARQIAERIRANIVQAGIVNPGTRRGGMVTISIGVAVSDTTHPPHDLQALLARADAALYAAKRNGRNRVEAWSHHLATDNLSGEPHLASSAEIK